MKFEGKILSVGEAYWDYMGGRTEPDIWATAIGVDENGVKYKVEYQLKEIFREADLSVLEQIEFEDLFDWENPYNITKIKD